MAGYNHTYEFATLQLNELAMQMDEMLRESFDSEDSSKVHLQNVKQKFGSGTSASKITVSH